MSKKGEYVKFKIFERRIKSPFMIYADFKSILVPQVNRNQAPEDSYTNKRQKHVIQSCGYKLVCVDDKFSSIFKSYLGKDAVHSFIDRRKYCTDMMKKHFNKKPVNTKEDDKDFENSTKCWICDSSYADGDVKVRDHCYIAGKYSLCTQRL